MSAIDNPRRGTASLFILAVACGFVLAAMPFHTMASAQDGVARHRTENLTSFHFHFGGGVGDKAVTLEMATRFVEDVVVSRFPTGTTLQEGAGQWLNPDTGEITREKSFLFALEVQPTTENIARLTEIAEEYVRRHREANASCFIRIYPNVATELYYSQSIRN